jgi:TonB-dependent starch-binding outer membrane protein SusC
MRYILLLAILCPFLTMCQPLSLRGKIVNESGEPIFGATITVLRSPGSNGGPTPNTKHQTPNGSRSSVIYHLSSGPSGEFSLTNLHLGDTILVTAIGYTPATEFFDETLSLHPVITIALKQKAATPDEIMIIAYHGFTILNNKNW